MIKRITYKKLEHITDYLASMLNDGWEMLRLTGSNDEYMLYIGKGIR